MNIYEKCPTLENEWFCVRLLEEQDVDDLLEVYSDKKALPFFNSDNCNGSNFYCAIREHMEGSVKFWLLEYYENKSFVRFSIVDKKANKVIGCIEMFHREANDSFNNCGMLRFDVRSDYENSEAMHSILDLIVTPFYDWFDCECIITKAPVYAVDRINALEKMHFTKSEEPLVGQNPRREYYDYWTICK